MEQCGAGLSDCLGAMWHRIERISLYFTITDLLTNFSQQSPLCDADSSPANPEIPSTVCNQKVRYLVHNSPPLFPVLSQINTIQAPSSHSVSVRAICRHLPFYVLVFQAVFFIPIFQPNPFTHFTPSLPHDQPILPYVTLYTQYV